MSVPVRVPPPLLVFFQFPVMRDITADDSPVLRGVEYNRKVLLDRPLSHPLQLL